MDSPSHTQRLEEVATEIAELTSLSQKQATALILREVLDASNSEIAETLDVASPASASSYVTRCRTKFDSVDEEIDKLERKIEKWEKTKQLESILSRLDFDSPETALRDLSKVVENELVDDEDVTYLMRYIDEQGQEQVQSVRTHPKNVEETDNNVEVVQYRRISSVDEVFE